MNIPSAKQSLGLTTPNFSTKNKYGTPQNKKKDLGRQSESSPYKIKRQAFNTVPMNVGISTNKAADDSISNTTSPTYEGSKLEVGAEESDSQKGSKRLGTQFKFGQKKKSESVEVKSSGEGGDKSKPSAERSDHPDESKLSSSHQNNSNRHVISTNQAEKKTVIPISKPHIKVQDQGQSLAQLRKHAMLNYGYNYSSKNKASLLYIPEGFLKLTPDASLRTTFSSFNDLSRSQKLSQMDNLEELIQEEYQPANYSQEEYVKKNLDLLSRKLMFNKMQKEAYKETLQTKMHSVIAPLAQQERIDNFKFSLMPRVKSYPSRQLISKNPSLLDEVALQNKEEQPELVDMRNQKVEHGITIEEAKLNHHIAFNYNFFWYYYDKEQISWKPTGREGATPTNAGKLIVMYGGLSNDVFDEIAVYDPQKKTWTQPKMSGEMPFFGRQCHTALEYQKSVIVFGGEKKFNPTIKMRECLNDTRSYNPEKNQWRFHKCIGHILEPRRSHTACILDKSMLIYGGINQYARYLRDVWSLNLKNYNWSEVSVISEIEEKGIAHHTMCAVYNRDPGAKGSKNHIATIEGIYVFGGKYADGSITNVLKILLTVQKPYRWYYPKVKGVPPVARFKHSMVVYPALAALIVYGGRNDSMYGHQEGFCLHDLRVLSLELMSWCPAASYGDGPEEPRCSHSVTLFESQMMLFGGLSNTKYANSNMRILELNQAASRRLIREFQYENNQNELERRLMLERVIMHNLQVEENNDNEIGGPSNLKGKLQAIEEKSRIMPIRSFLPMPKLSEKDMENEQKKLRAEVQAHVLKNKSKLRLMDLIGPTDNSLHRSFLMNNSSLNHTTGNKRTHKPSRGYLHLSGLKYNSSLNTTINKD